MLKAINYLLHVVAPDYGHVFSDYGMSLGQVLVFITTVCLDNTVLMWQ